MGPASPAAVFHTSFTYLLFFSIFLKCSPFPVSFFPSPHAHCSPPAFRIQALPALCSS